MLFENRLELPSRRAGGAYGPPLDWYCLKNRLYHEVV